MQAEACSSSQGPAKKCETSQRRSEGERSTSLTASLQAARRWASNRPSMPCGPQRTRAMSKGLVRFTATMPSSPWSAAGSGRSRKVKGAWSARTAARRSVAAGSPSSSGTSLRGPCGSTVKRRPRKWKVRPSSPRWSKKRRKSAPSFTRSIMQSRPRSSMTLMMRKAPRTQLRYTMLSRTSSGKLMTCCSSSSLKSSAEAMRQPSAMKAASSGPVKDMSSSARVGGGHVNSALQTLQTRCRVSLS
mmetsp:Transcript_58258/g.169107  ORF Transcript_58258/g.169107 Transcript_58258/m.169107 type:complete len:245 (-) Transcript_58258:160-894(-)